MKRLILPGMVLALLASCSKPAAENTTKEADMEVVRNFIDAAIKGDTANLGNYMADDARFYGPGINDSTTRDGELKFWNNGWKNEWSSMEFTRAGIIFFNVPQGQRYAGDWVSDWGIWKVNFKNGMAPVSFWWNGVFSVKNGKISVARAFYNLNDFFTQQGYTITAPPQK